MVAGWRSCQGRGRRSLHGSEMTPYLGDVTIGKVKMHIVVMVQ